MRPSEQMRALNLEWLQRAAAFDHLFQQRWLGERFFHLPGDVVALQELVWRVRPRLVVHTGIAAGGGPLLSASMLELLGGDGLVAAIDPALRPEARAALARHPLARRVRVLEGSSVDEPVVAAVRALAAERAPVLAILDLVHTHAHVRRELEIYGELVTPGSYVVVLDTIMEDLPPETFAGKPYGKGNNPGTAVRAFLDEDCRFEADREIEDRVLMTLAPGGFLKRVA
jgi:cephalosporin hydroxylase